MTQPEPGTCALEVRDVVAGYGGGDVLQGVSLQVMQGGITCVVGPNGAGKSTLLGTISGLLKPRLGQVTLFGERLTGMSPRQVLKSGVVQVPQNHSLFREMTVRENIALGGRGFEPGLCRRPGLELPLGLLVLLLDERQFRPRGLELGLDQPCDLFADCHAGPELGLGARRLFLGCADPRVDLTDRGLLGGERFLGPGEVAGGALESGRVVDVQVAQALGEPPQESNPK